MRIPVRRPKGKSEQALHVDTLMFNTLLRHVRALGERTAAELKQRWRTLQHPTLIGSFEFPHCSLLASPDMITSVPRLRRGND
ncbi:hypothetical protein [Streptantibioticus ferralitis]|uniref:hypothetical protein n=1 Tax=Streptantibioticus ferralitis TaxID=236510 RepID=UPI003556F9D2